MGRALAEVESFLIMVLVSRLPLVLVVGDTTWMMSPSGLLVNCRYTESVDARIQERFNEIKNGITLRASAVLGVV